MARNIPSNAKHRLAGKTVVLPKALFYVTSSFSLDAFKILSLSWNFVILIMMCLAVGLFGFLLIGTLCVSWIWVSFSLIKLGKFSIITFQTGFLSFALLLLLLYSYYMDIITFHVVLHFP